MTDAEPPVRAPWYLEAAGMALPGVFAVVQWFAWDVIFPYVWFFFYPTVFFSSWIGGLRAGLVSTALSAAIVVYVFIPPQWVFGGKPASMPYSVAVFMLMGVMVSVTHERLDRARRRAADALREAGLANDRLHAANAEVTQLYERTREMDRLKTQFFANVSHELRTPLTLILGSAARRLQVPGAPDDARRDLEVIHRNARLLHRHVNDLLDVSRVESGKLAARYHRVDLAQAVRRTASLFDVLAVERSITFRCDVPDALSSVVDVEKVERVLVNLLGNAFKFTPAGGRITVSLASVDDQARLAVADSGPGIPRDKRDVVFEAFRQLDGGADRVQGGTGLGLAIVRDFVRLLGGHVAIDDTPGGGTTMVVTLPLNAPAGAPVDEGAVRAIGDAAVQAVAELSDAPVVVESAAGGADESAPLILVVEDNPDMRLFLVQAFQQRYRVATAEDGQSGLDKAVELRPELILSDVMMPGMTGDRMVEALRSRGDFDDVPVVLLTAKADDDLKVRMLRLGVQDYVSKPFSEDEILARVDGLIAARRRARSEVRQMMERLEAHVRVSPMAVIEFDADYRIVRWAGQAESVFGWTAAEVLGKRLGDFRWVHEDDADRVRELSAEMVARPGSGNVHTNRNYRKDGTVITCDWHNSTIASETGALRSVLSLVLDVTARRAAAAELARLYQQAREDAEAKARLLMEVNHRVKNSLLALAGSFVAEQRLIGDAAGDVHRQVADRFTRRVRALLAAHEVLSRSSWAPMPLMRLANDIIRTTVGSLGTEQRIVIDVAPSDVLVSPRQVGAIALVLNELATNVVKHGLGPMGTTTISVSAALEGSRISLVVRDEGPGFPRSVLGGDAGGEGVGLRLVAEIVAGTLRGRLRLANNGGAVVTVDMEVGEPSST